MDKQDAIKIIRDTFERPFDRKYFTYFVKNLLNNIEPEDKHPYSGKYIPDAYKPFISTLKRIGKYKDSDHNKIDILIVHLKKPISLERARTMQRNFIAWYLKGSRGDILKDAALVAYVSPDYDDWRFSLVKMEYKLTQTESGRVKAKEELTPARRYSFLVGKNEPNHTAQQQLYPLLQDDVHNPTLAQLENAFSIEKVTKEFFEKYRELYLQLKESVDEIIEKDKIVQKEFASKNVDTVDFSKKLLGQIIFLYFLQKKGWLGVPSNKSWGDGDKGFLRSLFNKCPIKNKNFFNDYLEFLFYNTLNNPRQNEVDPSYSRDFDCRIPFLNGGLFEPIQGYDWKKTDINLDNNIFRKILDTFDLFNFTVKEDEPLEKEVAVDPEMLGKVFENLLPENLRKGQGTYYTPREIVHYMCQESLINYLSTELSSHHSQAHHSHSRESGNPVPSKEDIETLIHHGDFVVEHDTAKEKGTKSYKHKLSENIRQNAKLIDEKLETIKICDPAVGSGAFLVSMMTEIVKARNTLTTYLNSKNVILSNSQESYPSSVIASETKQSRSSRHSERSEESRTTYSFKRHAIQNCLYGVDIDPGAVEIAKLRLWLSLIVDEQDIKQIRPLPNLDYKIICGNSLLGVEKDLFNLDLFNKLEELKLLLFNETNSSKKQEYKNEIDKLIKEITNNDEHFDFEVYFSEVFHEKKGFDVVIANPPYVGEKGHKEIFKEVKNGHLKKFYLGKMDYFYFFFHLSLNIAKQNSNIAFITTNYYPTAMGAKKLRQDFKERAIIRNLMNFNELKIFESALGQHNMITILQKGQEKDAAGQTCITQRKGFATPELLQQILNGKDIETQYCKIVQKDLYDENEFYIRIAGTSKTSDNPVQRILDKIKTQGISLGIICNVNQGIVTGADKVSRKHLAKYKINAQVGNGIFILNKNEIKNLNLTEDEKEVLKPWFKNSDIHRWYAQKQTNEEIVYSNHETIEDIKEYPHLLKHLYKFKVIISQYAYRWFDLHRSRKQNIFEEAKIIAPQRSSCNVFGYNEIPWYASADVYFITEKDKSVYLKYVLSLCNSKLYYLWLYHRGKRKGEMLELYQKPLSEIPIKRIPESEQKPFVEQVDKILAITKDSDYLENPAKQANVREYEHRIDQMVYKLYGLTNEEIKIVENNKKGS